MAGVGVMASTLDRLGVFRMPRGGVAEERLDRGEAGVAGGHAIASLGFQMGEERRNQRGVDVTDVEPGGRCTGAVVGEDQQ